jgi:hydrogenase-4 component B
MGSELLVLSGLVLFAASGVPGLFLSRRSTVGQWSSIVLSAMGGGLGLAGIAVFWVLGTSRPIVLPWAIPGGAFDIAIDGLSAIFLLPIFLISALGSIYGLGYWKPAEHLTNCRKLRLFYGLLAAGMVLLVVARNSILFLFGWEIMAMSAFFLITTEDDRQEIRDAGWIYLVATHVATLALFALFAVLRAANGSFAITSLNMDALSPGAATAIFVLALLAFGIKAGLMPLHVWLPSAHAITPSHVSVILSGVILKMGIYGIVRVMSLFPHPPLPWGGVLLALGTLSGVLGVAFAIGQHDLKRLLAYHSIENIGIIVMGIGLAVLGRSLGRAELVMLGLSGALLHVWNHALFKSLLFFSAGSVVHAVHTREIDRLGGLAKHMPQTALAFLIGAVAICGLPPLNGFVSEFLVYLGLFGTLKVDSGGVLGAAAFVAPALALIGALAVACFVKVFGAVFLGVARGSEAERARESEFSMIMPMGVLAACCIFIGLVPTCLVPVLEKGVAAWAPELAESAPRLVALAPLGWISRMAVLLLAALVLTGAVLRFRLRRGALETAATWGCGYVAPSPRMQYTSSSFAQMLVDLFAWVLRPRFHRPGRLEILPDNERFESHVPDPVLDEAVLPTFRFGGRLLLWFRVLQQGNIQVYVLYIFLALIALLMWR